MRVLVTGAGGIGTHTARGDEVDNQPDLKAARIVVGDHEAPVECCDVSNSEAIDEVVARHAVTEIVHTAAILMTASNERPVDLCVNVLAPIHLLDMQRAGIIIRRAVFASSITVAYALFDGHTRLPMPEDFCLNILSHRPKSVYSTTKLIFELAALAYRDRFDIRPVVLRYATLVGGWPYGDGSIPGRMLNTLPCAGATRESATFNDPKIIWLGVEEFIDVRNAARANAALDAEAPEQAVYNVADDELPTFDDVIGMAREIYPELTIDVRARTSGGLLGSPHPHSAGSDLRISRHELPRVVQDAGHHAASY